MRIKKYVILGLTVFLSTVCFQSASAYDPNWKQEQDEMFAKLGIKPGDVIDKSNCDKIKGHVPEAIITWIKKQSRRER